MTEKKDKHLQDDPLFKQLTLKQQNFLLEYQQTLDSTEAVLNAFDCKKETTAQSYVHKLLNNTRIRRLIRTYINPEIDYVCPTSRHEFLVLLSQRLRNPQLSDTMFCQLTDSLLAITGWRPRRRVIPLSAKPAPAKTEVAMQPDIDALVLQIENNKKK
jgi:hypothetical protein